MRDRQTIRQGTGSAVRVRRPLDAVDALLFVLAFGSLIGGCIVFKPGSIVLKAGSTTQPAMYVAPAAIQIHPEAVVVKPGAVAAQVGDPHQPVMPPEAVKVTVEKGAVDAKGAVEKGAVSFDSRWSWLKYAAAGVAAFVVWLLPSGWPLKRRKSGRG